MGQSRPSTLKNTFFIDECLSPKLVVYARSRDIEAISAQFRNLAAAKDWKLVPYVIENDYVLVTCNARDFFKLYANEEIHPGLVIILPEDLKIDEQVVFFSLVLDRIEEEDLVNKVVTIDREKRIEILDWSKGNTGTPPPPGL